MTNAPDPTHDDETVGTEQPEPDRDAAAPSPLRSAGRGLVAAMAMSGMREVTTGLGWLERTPPEEILSEEAPSVVRSLPEDRARVAVQLAHWGYGTAAGFAYGLLPARFRRSRFSGPTYGMLAWLSYEFGIAPALGVQVAERRSVMSRVTLVADHLLYGLVLGGSLGSTRPRPSGG